MADHARQTAVGGEDDPGIVQQPAVGRCFNQEAEIGICPEQDRHARLVETEPRRQLA